MWSIEKNLRAVPYFPYVQRYDWVVMFSSYGAATGTALTRKQAERRLSMAQGQLLAP